MSIRTESLRKIKEEIFAGKHLPLYKERVKNKVFPVIGEGNNNARIIFIGEAPGKKEAESGKPFCGASGKVLDQLLESAGIQRNDVYITNIVKDRPPMNRDPLLAEIESYSEYLDRQIQIIQPEVIATLGRFSMSYIMDKFGLGSPTRATPEASARRELGKGGIGYEMQSISRMHGKVFDAKTSYGSVKIIPLYHPAVAVYNASRKDELKKDFKILKKFK